ncbi:unnamed protein product [Rhizophagus irregularis]|nr:unnamed protein product [Rhizophagus irregularis]
MMNKQIFLLPIYVLFGILVTPRLFGYGISLFGFRRVETLVQDHLLLLVHHRPLLGLGHGLVDGSHFGADGSGKFFFGLILNRQVSIIELAGFPPLGTLFGWVGFPLGTLLDGRVSPFRTLLDGFPLSIWDFPFGLYWMGGFPLQTLLDWFPLTNWGFPLRTLLDWFSLRILSDQVFYGFLSG